MRAFCINCSPREPSNTEILLKTVRGELNESGIDTEIRRIGGKPVRGCTACLACREKQMKKCVFDDAVNECIKKMIEADIIIIGSPVYFSDITAEAKALIDRSGYVARGNGNLFKRKIGAGVVSLRRAGAIPSIDSIQHFFMANEMIIPGSSYWNLAMGKNPGDVNLDEEGIKTMKTLGRNIAWLAKKIR